MCLFAVKYLRTTYTEIMIITHLIVDVIKDKLSMSSLTLTGMFDSAVMV